MVPPHVIVAVNHDTAGMYRRLGFTPLKRQDLESRKSTTNIIPLATPADTFTAWALGNLDGAPLTSFEDSFERIVLRAGEVLFEEGDAGVGRVRRRVGSYPDFSAKRRWTRPRAHRTSGSVTCSVNSH